MKKRFEILIVIVVASLVTTTVLFWIFEHEANAKISTFGDALWWWVITSTTVG